jgi:S1-C subfamily serine protease
LLSSSRVRPAAAGIQPGDVIIAVNGNDTPTAESFLAAIHGAKPGDHLKLTVVRGDQTTDITVPVADRPAT